ncbi:hypothetical protein LX15_002239 [Streptoalloteichus tenebrarius]|uniref:GNAT family N-acetyltransferase n=1 Tax=Streptoalloteichus tenebrarius (strain ATCC 17920 / DSM 40477 / JCM 4838 / CBS 697.72 / NBRC 16177 / NCIMB 11028 / NRRL B-12390 / A12253. 1 / ISP 5477) TaxID=1933 RepID=A0ABT1HSQ3_STRSD|nr:hypothetical protein [Streptoalloteichus tenebrarius]MCP2258541.1 hypothetical protein [Streptoalloteichus tenebrarius]BFF04093.1 hypothetical protein GCM10020241_57680 [Streptoalloteichus tenebrarius]
MRRTDVSLEFARDPGVEAGLVRELLTALGQPAPDEVSSIPDDGWPSLVGVVVARHDSALLGWTRVSAHEEDESVATADLLLVSREAVRLSPEVQSGPDSRPHGTAEDVVVARLLAGAADQARDAGFTALEWSGLDDSAEGVAAGRLGAAPHQEVGRHWGVGLDAWSVSATLPDVATRRVFQPVNDDLLAEYARLYHDATGLEWDAEDVAEYLGDDARPLLTLDLLDGRGAPRAQVTAVVTGRTALVEKVVHRAVPDADLAALVAALLTELAAALGGGRSEVAELSVRELHDPAVARACALAGLRITSRWLTFRLPL